MVNVRMFTYSCGESKSLNLRKLANISELMKIINANVFRTNACGLLNAVNANKFDAAIALRESGSARYARALTKDFRLKNYGSVAQFNLTYYSTGDAARS